MLFLVYYIYGHCDQSFWTLWSTGIVGLSLIHGIMTFVVKNATQHICGLVGHCDITLYGYIRTLLAVHRLAWYIIKSTVQLLPYIV